MLMLLSFKWAHTCLSEQLHTNQEITRMFGITEKKPGPLTHCKTSYLDTNGVLELLDWSVVAIIGLGRNSSAISCYEALRTSSKVFAWINLKMSVYDEFSLRQNFCFQRSREHRNFQYYDNFLKPILLRWAIQCKKTWLKVETTQQPHSKPQVLQPLKSGWPSRLETWSPACINYIFLIN